MVYSHEVLPPRRICEPPVNLRPKRLLQVVSRKVGTCRTEITPVESKRTGTGRGSGSRTSYYYTRWTSSRSPLTGTTTWSNSASTSSPSTSCSHPRSGPPPPPTSGGSDEKGTGQSRRKKAFSESPGGSTNSPTRYLSLIPSSVLNR